MKVVVTGGMGFIGQRLARRLLELGAIRGPSGDREDIDEILLFDQTAPDARPEGFDERVRIVAGDIGERDAVFSLIDRDDISVFHLASVA